MVTVNGLDITTDIALTITAAIALTVTAAIALTVAPAIALTIAPAIGACVGGMVTASLTLAGTFGAVAGAGLNPAGRFVTRKNLFRDFAVDQPFDIPQQLVFLC